MRPSAQKLGFERSPPAYLSIRNDGQARGGVNFASGGSGIFDSTVRLSLLIFFLMEEA